MTEPVLTDKTLIDWLGWLCLVLPVTAVWAAVVLFGQLTETEFWQAMGIGTAFFAFAFGWGLCIVLFDAIEARLQRR